MNLIKKSSIKIKPSGLRFLNRKVYLYKNFIFHVKGEILEVLNINTKEWKTITGAIKEDKNDKIIKIYDVCLLEKYMFFTYWVDNKDQLTQYKLIKFDLDLLEIKEIKILGNVEWKFTSQVAIEAYDNELCIGSQKGIILKCKYYDSETLETTREREIELEYFGNDNWTLSKGRVYADEYHSIAEITKDNQRKIRTKFDLNKEQSYCFKIINGYVCIIYQENYNIIEFDLHVKIEIYDILNGKLIGKFNFFSFNDDWNMTYNKEFINIMHSNHTLIAYCKGRSTISFFDDKSYEKVHELIFQCNSDNVILNNSIKTEKIHGIKFVCTNHDKSTMIIWCGNVFDEVIHIYDITDDEL